MAFFGLFLIMFCAWLISTNRKMIHWQVIASGLVLQFILALLILKTSMGSRFFETAHKIATSLISLSDAGAAFIFGEGFAEHFFAFKVLPTIIFISSLSAIAFHIGLMQKIVGALAWIMRRCMGISGAESLVAAANIFCGQTEAPLVVRPYIKVMTRSELMVMMTSGMATVAGGVMAAYVGMGISAGHLLAASLMSAPAAILIARIMQPEHEQSHTAGKVDFVVKSQDPNLITSACRGAAEGLQLALNVAAMLIAFIALVALVNLMLTSVSGALLGREIRFEDILGYAFYPFAWIIGISSEDCFGVARLLGERTVLNEFIAYVHLADLIKAGAISERSASVATYAMCGFANFSSVAIQIGGIGGLEPSRRGDFAVLGMRAMIGATLACFMTACWASILI